MEQGRVLADFPLADGTLVRVAVPKPVDASALRVDDSALEEVGILDQPLYRAKETIESALGKLTPIATAVMSGLKAGLPNPADEVEVKFGLDLSVESGVILSSVGGSVNFEVTLKWSGKTP